MKIKTSELTGPALDWAVAKCMGFQTARMVRGHGYTPDTNLAKAKYYTSNDVQQGQLGTGFARSAFNPSTDWAQGGPIIEREKIGTFWNQGREEWQSYPIKPQPSHYGPTPLIAAMRCYVASKLGDEVEIPEELK